MATPTLEQYRDALDAFLAARSPREIQRTAGLTRQQYNALYHVGLPAVLGRKALPGFARILHNELVKINGQRNRAARSVSSKAVGVLQKAAENAGTAATIVRMILRLQEERLEAELAKPAIERAEIESVMLGPTIYKALDVLHKHQDLSSAARVFDRIWGAKPADHSAMPHMPGVRVLPGAGSDTLPAAYAMLEEVAGSGTIAALDEAIMREMRDWSDDEKDHFAKTGEEPIPPVGFDDEHEPEEDDELEVIDTVVVDAVPRT